MVLAARAIPPSSLEVWRLIEKDLTLRLSLKTREWNTQRQKDINAIAHEARRRGNASYYYPALIEYEEKHINERAEWSYKTCCEVWEIQGQKKSHAFYRAVFDGCLTPLFSLRKGVLTNDIQIRERRLNSGSGQSTGALRSFAMAIERLRADWNTRLEIASRDNDYQQQQIREQEQKEKRTSTAPIPASAPILLGRLSEAPADDERTQSQGKTLTNEQVAAVASTFTWKELESRFQLNHAKTKVHISSATFIRTNWETGDVTEEWFMGGSPAWRKEFEHLSSIAARKLGCSQSENADEFWLGLVLKWMQHAGLDKDKDMAWSPSGIVYDGKSNGTTQSLRTERIAELSAMFCVELITRGAPQSAVLPPSKESNSQRPAPAIPAIRTKAPPKAITAPEKQKRRAIFGAIQAGDKGQKYCKTVDERKLKIPAEWIQCGCPKTYADAYKVGQPWRKRIQDEKSRYKKKYDQTPAIEREGLLQ
jgi:hypothetical protein